MNNIGKKKQPLTTEDVEAEYRKVLAAKKPPIVKDEEIVSWLKGLGTAISAWEARWLKRLEQR